MAFKPGQSGNPKGADPKQRRFLTTLERAIIQDDGKRLREAVEKLLDHAASGEPWAIGMLADRLDGKAMQFLDVKRSMDELSDDELGRIIEGLRSALAASEVGDGGVKQGGAEQAQVLSTVH